MGKSKFSKRKIRPSIHGEKTISLAVTLDQTAQNKILSEEIEEIEEIEQTQEETFEIEQVQEQSFEEVQELEEISQIPASDTSHYYSPEDDEDDEGEEQLEQPEEDISSRYYSQADTENYDNDDNFDATQEEVEEVGQAEEVFEEETLEEEQAVEDAQEVFEETFDGEQAQVEKHIGEEIIDDNDVFAEDYSEIDAETEEQIEDKEPEEEEIVLTDEDKAEVEEVVEEHLTHLALVEAEKEAQTQAEEELETEIEIEEPSQYYAEVEHSFDSQDDIVEGQITLEEAGEVCSNLPDGEIEETFFTKKPIYVVEEEIEEPIEEVQEKIEEKIQTQVAQTEEKVASKEDIRRKYMVKEGAGLNIAKIMVIGVGGGGNNAVNRMIEMGVENAKFVAINTDKQILLVSKCNEEDRYQIGENATKGLGAGADPEVGEKAAEESRELIESIVDGMDLVFITAGMGGGTGTGAAPVIAKIAREKGCLTIAVVTKPFYFEAKKRAKNAEKGIENLKKYVDTIIIIPNDRLIEAMPPETSFQDALAYADDTLRQGVCGIADLISTPSLINLDFADLRTIIKSKGLAHMGIGRSKGENRVIDAVQKAISSPLLETSIEGARGVILNVTGGKDLTLRQVADAAKQVQDVIDPSAEVIFGANINEKLQEEIIITLIATGFDSPAVLDEETEQATQVYKQMFARPQTAEVNPSQGAFVEPTPVVEQPIQPQQPQQPQQAPQQEFVSQPFAEEKPKKELPSFMKRLFKK